MSRGASSFAIVLLILCGCDVTHGPDMDSVLRPAQAAIDLRAASSDIDASARTITDESARVEPVEAGERIRSESSRIRDRASDVHRTADQLDVTDDAVKQLERTIKELERSIAAADQEHDRLRDEISALERQLVEARSEARRSADRFVYIGSALAIAGGIFLTFAVGWKWGVPLILAGAGLLSLWRFLDKYEWLIDLAIGSVIVCVIAVIAYLLWRHRHAFYQVSGELISIGDMLDDDAKRAADEMIEQHQTKTTKQLFHEARERLQG